MLKQSTLWELSRQANIASIKEQDAALAKGQAVIYALVDPRTHQTRYIGCTTRPLGRRNDHKSYGRGDTPEKWEWVSELREAGLAPLMVILEVCSKRDMYRREYGQLLQHAAKGTDLLNRGW